MRTSILVLIAFVAGFGSSHLLSKKESPTDHRLDEHSALLYQSLSSAADATFALLMIEDEEKAKRWHLQRFDSAVSSALQASEEVKALEMPVPNILAALEKSYGVLETNQVPTSSVERLRSLEQWLRIKHLEAVEADV